jgi:hypothetical protein
MTEPSGNARAQAAVAADLLVHGATVNRLSLALTASAVLAFFAEALLQPHRIAMALTMLAVLAGLAQLWFALRVGFDARAFRRLAGDDALDGLSLSAFDGAMGSLGLMPAEKERRPIAERVRGAMRLLGRQFAFLLLQVVLLVAGGWVLAAAKG